MNTITLNGVSSETIQGLLIQSLPPISKPPMRVNVEEIDGRNGDIITDLGYQAYDKTITIGLRGSFDINDVISFFNSEGTVVFSNEPDKYYRYKIYQQIDFERLIRYRVANVTMHVQPFKYPLNETPISVSSLTWEGTEYDQTPYIFRAVSDSSVEVGNREIIEQITGGTVAWNQLVSSSATSVTITNGHKYVLYSGSAWSIGASTGSAITVSGSGGAKLFDLTQMFGTAIADYEYNQGSANCIAWFRGLFPNATTAAYNAGELMSVKTSAHKTYDANDNVLGNYPISPIELRGIPQLVSNKLQYDGDIYKADGSVERRFAIVDLGTLNWTKSSSSDIAFYSSGVRDYAQVKTVGQASYGNAITSKYVFKETSIPPNGTFSLYYHAGVSSNRLFVSDDDFTGKTAAEVKASLSGVYLVYELATPTTETTTPYTETQICDADGTEEFIDDRDVQIPVGHKTRYEQIDPINIEITNSGNVPSMPTYRIEGSGSIDVNIDGLHAVTVDMSNINAITINSEEMNAYNDTGGFANRAVTGSYENLALPVGENTLEIDGDGVINLLVTNYERWL